MRKVFKGFVIGLSLLLAVSIFASVIYLPIYNKKNYKLNLFSSQMIVDNIKNLEMNLTSVVYVKDNEGKWQEYKRIHGEENRIWVSIDKIPENLKNAFIAIEDETFYEHSGINWKRTFGAIGNYFFKFDDTEFGGSTITQQLIKNVTMDNARDAKRKLREIVRALIVEAELDKEPILEAYLNTIALGNGICGVQVAANYYFNKDVEDLNLAECAVLAAITQNPSKYNPLTNLENNKERQEVVLTKMLNLDMISHDEHKRALFEDIKIDDTQKDAFEEEINDYFVDALIDEVIVDLAKKYNCSEELASSMLYNGGYKIYATVDTDIQNKMESVYTNVNKYFRLKGKNTKGETVHVQSAMTIMDYEGHIVGIVGGAGEKTVNRGLNRATSSPRQPGSTMKPLGVYALAIEKDLVHYTSVVEDKPIDKYYPDGKKGPKEWYGYYKGNITIDYAVRKSANTIPVILLKEMGVEPSYDFLTKTLGCKYLNETDKNLASLALGGCSYGLTTTESAAAYAIFGNGGKYYEPTTYTKITDVNDKVILEYKTKPKQAISSATATIMNHLLQGVVYGSEGTGGLIASYNSMKAFAKTGTSSESNDLWMVAGSPYYVGSVWYGFDKMQQVNSTTGAAVIWRDVMKEIHKGLEKKTFTDSEDVYKKGSGYYKNGTKPDNLSGMQGEIKEEETVEETPPEQVTPPSDTPLKPEEEKPEEKPEEEKPEDTPETEKPEGEGEGEKPEGETPTDKPQEPTVPEPALPGTNEGSQGNKPENSGNGNQNGNKPNNN